MSINILDSSHRHRIWYSVYTLRLILSGVHSASRRHVHRSEHAISIRWPPCSVQWKRTQAHKVHGNGQKLQSFISFISSQLNFQFPQKATAHRKRERRLAERIYTMYARQHTYACTCQRLLREQKKNHNKFRAERELEPATSTHNLSREYFCQLPFAKVNDNADHDDDDPRSRSASPFVRRTLHHHGGNADDGHDDDMFHVVCVCVLLSVRGKSGEFLQVVSTRAKPKTTAMRPHAHDVRHFRESTFHNI